MFQDILDLPPEIIDCIYKCCYTSDLINLACCSKAHYDSLQYLLWRTVVVTKNRMEKELLPTKILGKLTFTSDLRIFDYGKTLLSPGWLNTTINCKNVLNHCNGEMLTKLDIKTIATDRTLRLMSVKLKNLQELRLRSCYSVTNLGWQYMLYFNCLKKLTLKNCSLFDCDVAEIVKLVHLEKLLLIECDNITDTSMELISHLTELRKLTVSSNRYVTVSGLVHITKLINLIELDLSFSTINDYIISCFCAVPIKLKKLDISLCSDVTDFGIMELSTLGSLEQLNIQDDCVSKNVLNSFCEYTGMKEIYRYSHLCDDITLKR